MNLAILYIVAVNIVAATLFSYDKFCAETHRWRIPEKVLHLLELMGGVAAVLVFMYALRHKNRKFSYFIWTYLILALWLLGIYAYADGLFGEAFGRLSAHFNT